MTCGILTTIANVPVKIPIVVDHPNGIRILGRAANTNDTFVGFVSSKGGSTANITTTGNVNLIPKGAPETSIPYTIPGEHFKNGEAWVVSGTDGMLIDWAGG